MLDKLKSKKFWENAIARAIRTICQTAIATIGTNALIADINWVLVASASAVSGILSLLTSVLMGIPESEESEE